MTKYTEEIKGKLVEVMYDENKIKTHCTLCKKSLGDTFEKRKANYLDRGNFCGECSANASKNAYVHYVTRNKSAALSL